MTWIVVIALCLAWFVAWLIYEYPWHCLQLTVATLVGGYSAAHGWLGSDGHRPVMADFWLGLAAALLVTVAINGVVSLVRRIAGWLRGEPHPVPAPRVHKPLDPSRGPPRRRSMSLAIWRPL